MNFQQATNLLDQRLQSFRGKGLTDAELVALKAAWSDVRYDEAIADHPEISVNYVSSRVGPELWKTLTDCFQYPLKKKNIRRFLESQPENDWPEASVQDDTSAFSNMSFLGRETEVQSLRHMLSSYQCINLCGESGIGKTHLVKHLITHLDTQSSFEQVIFLSVCHAPQALELCQLLLQELKISPHERWEDETFLLNQLFEQFKKQRILVVLDSAEVWMNQNIDIESVIRRICEERLQSVVVLISRQPFPIISALQTKRYACKVFRIEGLMLEHAHQLLELYGLQTPEVWPQLIQKYRANPLALMQAAEMILNLFDGQVQRFIDLETTVVFDTFEEAYRSYPFAPEECDFLRTLTKMRQATISQIMKAFPESQSKVIALLNTLLANSFIDRHITSNGYVYSVPPMLQKFLTHQFERVGES